MIEYKTPEYAFEEASRRLANKSLQERTLGYLGNVLPPGLEDIQTPVAVYAPYLATASQVEVEFLEQVTTQGFAPRVATYKQSEFVTANAALVDCYRPPLLLTKGQSSRTWIVPERYRLGAIGDADTIYEELDINNYWTGLRTVVLEEKNLLDSSRVVDFSDWYQLQAKRFGWQDSRSKAPYYYCALMGLYASGRAVLYDTPPTRFADQVMKPAADKASEALGVEPLLTCELKPGKRSWTDLSFLNETDCQKLQETGRI